MPMIIDNDDLASAFEHIASELRTLRREGIEVGSAVVATELKIAMRKNDVVGDNLAEKLAEHLVKHFVIKRRKS